MLANRVQTFHMCATFIYALAMICFRTAVKRVAIINPTHPLNFGAAVLLFNNSWPSKPIGQGLPDLVGAIKTVPG